MSRQATVVLVMTVDARRQPQQRPCQRIKVCRIRTIRSDALLKVSEHRVARTVRVVLLAAHTDERTVALAHPVKRVVRVGVGSVESIAVALVVGAKT